MNGAQITWIIINFVSLGISLAKHGERKEGNYNFFTALIALVIDYAVMKWGGFF